MRLKGYYNLEDIDYLIMETNGEISIVAHEDRSGEKCKRIPISIILDGKIMYKNLEKFEVKENILLEELEENNLKLKEVIYGFIDEDDKFIFYKR
jgi:uncharacterized membrane protein YcaP (DUF421 family)